MAKHGSYARDNKGCEQCEEALSIDGPKAGACFECFADAIGMDDPDDFWASGKSEEERCQ